MTRQLLTPADRTYVPRYYPGATTLFRPIADRHEGTTYDSHMGWKGLAAEITTYDIPGDRHTIFREPDVRVLADTVNQILRRALLPCQRRDGNR